MALTQIVKDGLGASLTATSEGGAVTTSVQQGLNKVWINAPAAKNSINDSFNVSSLDDDGAGDFGVHYTNDFASTNYCFAPGMDDGGSTTGVMGCDGTNGSYTTSSTDFETYYGNTGNNRTNIDQYSFLMFTGDLA